MSNLTYLQPEYRPLPQELLVMYRQRASLTQLDLAQQLGFKGSKMLQLWENGYQLPTAARLKKLIEIYYPLSVFSVGKERLEIIELWQSVKDAFDSRSESYQTYPIFDKHWFANLTKVANFSPLVVLAPTVPTLSSNPHNLPALPFPLIGREQELAQLRSWLTQPQPRLVTLIGPGGSGKTRLALQIAEQLLPHFKDGVFLVRLATIHDPALVLPQIAQALGVKEAGNLLTSLQLYLRERHVLLTLDNFEQLIPGVEELSQLLEASPGLKILVTSRIVLRLYGEQEFYVPPLPLPLPNAQQPEELVASPAVRLFLERARLIQPDFRLTLENAAAVKQICIHLEGLPMALELASASLKLFSPQMLLGRLTQAKGARLNLLSAGMRTAAEHQKTLRSTLEWSYRLLAPSLQKLFNRLTVFTGQFSLSAAQAICADLSIPYIEQDLSELLDHSLLRTANPAQPLSPTSDVPHFEMLEIIREYGLENLALSEEEFFVRQQHCNYYLAWLEEAQAGLRTAQQAEWLDQLEQQHPNLRQALEWALHTAPEQALRFGVVLTMFWNMRGYLAEGQRWAKAILAQPLPDAPALRARLLNNAAILAGRQSATQAASQFLHEALELWRELDDRRNISMALNNLGVLAFQQGHLAQAGELYAECLLLKRELGEPRGVAMALNNLGELLHQQGQLATAQALYQESLEILQNLGDKANMAIALLNLGKLAQQTQQTQPAIRFLLTSLSELLTIGDKFNLAENLESLAQSLANPELGAIHWVARLCSAASFLRQELGAPLSASQELESRQLVSTAQAQIDPMTWQQAWQLGQTTSLEQLLKDLTEASAAWLV